MNGGTGHATLRSLPTRSEIAAADLVDEALQLFGYSRDILNESLPTMRMNAGAEHLFLALRHRADLAGMNYDLMAGRAFMQRHGIVTILVAHREGERLFHVRNAFASGGVLEDPATGAAAAALAGMLRDQGVLTPGELTILQGADMGRPSRIHVRFDGPNGSPVYVSGAAVKIT